VEAGTTKNTVSKALRGAPGVGEETRSRILRLADEYGYTRHVVRGAEGANRAAQITMVCKEEFLNEPFFWAAVFSGVWEGAAEGRASIRCVISEKIVGAPSQMAEFNAKFCDGILAMGYLSDELLVSLSRLGIPMVVVDHYTDAIDCDFVNSANRAGVVRAVRYLAGMGHTAIGFVNNERHTYTYSYHERYRGYANAMKTLGLPVVERFVWPKSTFDNSEVYFYERIAAMEKQGGDRPTAFVCVNDLTGWNLLTALNARGYRVPEDFSLVGFDNNLVYGPQLTSMDVPQKTFGRRALQTLLRRLEAPDAPFEHIQIATTLVERDTVRDLRR